MAFMVIPAGCSMIDEDQSDCAETTKIDYDLTLITNITTEIETQLETELSTELEMELAAQLRNYLSGVFTDFAHDVDLSFYDTQGDSLRLQHDEHIMDANQASYALNLPMRQYMHLATANILDNKLVTLEDDERCHRSKLEQVNRDTIESHSTGVFTARQPMEVLEGIDQNFKVHLYMANCAAALVIDPKEHDISSLKVFTTGFATKFNICDSTYTFASKSPIVRTAKVTTDNSSELCFVSVNFPSREPKATRSIIETTEPFIAKDGDETLWQFKAYITNADGTITETILSLRQPLRAGQLKIIKGYVTDNGSVQTSDQTVGVSVTLDWNEGMHQDIPL